VVSAHGPYAAGKKQQLEQGLRDSPGVPPLERKLWSQRLCQWIRFQWRIQRISVTRQHPVVVSVEVIGNAGGDITAG
jgi:hypothetical protein